MTITKYLMQKTLNNFSLVFTMYSLNSYIIKYVLVCYLINVTVLSITVINSSDLLLVNKNDMHLIYD